MAARPRARPTRRPIQSASGALSTPTTGFLPETQAEGEPGDTGGALDADDPEGWDPGADREDVVEVGEYLDAGDPSGWEPVESSRPPPQHRLASTSRPGRWRADRA